ncbi:MAG TPA: hypothetical protein VJQ50_00830 [Terriglobales bacterium]|nr:hypothetical protein [Terriglobales bacterium]
MTHFLVLEFSANQNFFIENVFEELNAPHEWYLDRERGLLYFFPAPGTDMQTAVVEVPVLDWVIQFGGTQGQPVQHVRLQGFRFAHTKSL